MYKKRSKFWKVRKREAITIKLNLKQIREQKGISLRALSEISQVSISYLSELEDEKNSKKNPSIEVICKLAKALGVKPEELFECD